MPDTDRLDLDAIAAREQAASKEVARLCNGGRWEMQVPARDDADSDMVISAALADVRTLSEEVRRLTAENADTCRTLRTLLADPGDDLSGADLGELLEMAQATIHGLQVRADTNRAWAEDYRAQRDQARAELATARREERERCAAAVADLADRQDTAALRFVVGLGADHIRVLPDEDTPATEETP